MLLFIHSKHFKTATAMCLAALFAAACFMTGCANNTSSNQETTHSQNANQEQEGEQPMPEQTTPTDTDKTQTTGVHHVAALNEIFTDNTTLWCAPMQLCWNEATDMVGPFQEANATVRALNARTTEKNDIGEDHYYTYANLISNPEQTYTEITEALKTKFNEDSEILDINTLKQAQNNYYFYSMLFREFAYEIPFDLVNDGDGVFGSDTYGNVQENVSYFGIDSDSEQRDAKASQVEVLYYDDFDHCAVLLKTKQNDLVICVKDPKGPTGLELWNNTVAKAGDYTGSRQLENDEYLKIPLADFVADDYYPQLSGVLTQDNRYMISSARQRTEFKMDQAGGRVKSEAEMMVKAAAFVDEELPRDFIFDDRYAVFLVDGNVFNAQDYQSMKPYLALLVNRVEDVQKIDGANITKNSNGEVIKGIG